jgi:hypothetical protein
MSDEIGKLSQTPSFAVVSFQFLSLERDGIRDAEFRVLTSTSTRPFRPCFCFQRSHEFLFKHSIRIDISVRTEMWKGGHEDLTRTAKAINNTVFISLYVESYPRLDVREQIFEDMNVKLFRKF